MTADAAAADRPASPLTADDPRQLGPYQLVGRLGSGGMGIVYLAETQAGARAAVKVINPLLARQPAFRERFRREVDAARRVRQFCTAAVIDAQLEDEPLYVATEYVDGPDLARYIKDHGPMRGSSLEHLAVGVATALSAIHSAGVIHRDLKPANVLLSSLGPKVIDFGIARALDATAQITGSGALVGTPAYMAPEVVTGEDATAAADVFAWGAVVAFAGTGTGPFEAPNIPAVLHRITTGQARLEGLDGPVREIVAEALQRSPGQRPTTRQILNRLTGHTDTEQAAEAVRMTWPGATSVGPTTTTAQPTPASKPPTAAQQARARPDMPSHRPARPWYRRFYTGWGLAATCGVAALVVAAPALKALSRDTEDPPGNAKAPSQHAKAPSPDSKALAGVAATRRIYNTDFQKPPPGWAKRGVLLHDGMLRVHIPGGERSGAVAFPHSPLPRRLLMEITLLPQQWDPSTRFGFWCRGGGGAQRHAYEFMISGAGKDVLVQKATNGSQPQLLKRAALPPGFGQKGLYRIHMACEETEKSEGSGVRLRLWIDKTLIVEHIDSDNPHRNGDSGILLTRADNPRVADTLSFARYDDFALSEITPR